MFIKYTGTNVHAFPNINSVALKEMKKLGRNNKTMIQSPQDVKWLRPGWNEFPKDCWDQNKDNPSIQRMLKSGTIVLMSYKAKIRVRLDSGKIKLVERMIGIDDKPVKLKYFDDAMAIQVAKETYDRDLLQRWLDEDNRAKVKKVLRKQIEPLLNTGDDDDDMGDDFEDDTE